MQSIHGLYNQEAIWRIYILSKNWKKADYLPKHLFLPEVEQMPKIFHNLKNHKNQSGNSLNSNLTSRLYLLLSFLWPYHQRDVTIQQVKDYFPCKLFVHGEGRKLCMMGGREEEQKEGGRGVGERRDRKSTRRNARHAGEGRRPAAACKKKTFY